MKKFILSLLVVAMTSIVMARHVDPATARRVAETYLAAHGMHNPTALVDVSSQTPYSLFYTFVAPDGGFALVSADDCVRPILGYSPTGRFNVKDMPEHIASWLADYEREIAYWQNHQDGPNPTLAAEWNMLSSGVVPAPLTTAMTDTLTTKWNQAPYYNIMCPIDERHWSGHPYAGCVATAMSQIMKYWDYPVTGFLDNGYDHPYRDDTTYGWIYADFDNTTYQWASMPDTLDWQTTGAEDTAVGTLMFHCGVAINMGYGISGSGASTGNYGDFYSKSAENALITNFKYSPALHSIYRCDFSADDWNSRLRAEIDGGRPILYSGNDVGMGHAFVFDGYNDDGYFHVNWGWGAYCDGYYPVGGLNPAPGGAGGNSTSSYNNNNVAIIGIQPNLNWGSGGTITATANDATRGGVDVYGGNYNFGDTITLVPYVTHGNRFVRWSDGYPAFVRRILGTGGDYSFTAIFDTVGSDTIALHSSNVYLTGWGNPTLGEFTWGIKLDRSLLANGRELHGVRHFIAYPGDYDMYIYAGDNNPDYLMYQTTVNYSEEDNEQWHTIELDEAVVNSGWEDLYITFHHVGFYEYPAICTFYSGIDESLCFPYNPSGDYYSQYSYLIEGLFRDATALPELHITLSSVEQVSVDTMAHFEATSSPNATITWHTDDGATATGSSANFSFSTPGQHLITAVATLGNQQASNSWYITVVDYNEGDTVSYCLNRGQWDNVGENYGNTQWGIRLPSDYLVYRDSLVDVLLYIGPQGSYTMKIYNGANINPNTLLYTQTYTIEEPIYGYYHCTPEHTLSIDRHKDLWIVFESDAPYPAMGCYYLGDPNSDWYAEDGVSWTHLTDLAPWLSQSWLIKAVTAVSPTYHLTVASADVTMGLVEGDGDYRAGDQVLIKAIPATGYLFDHWQDNNTDAERTVTVTADAEYTAYFKHNDVGIDNISVDGTTVSVDGRTLTVNGSANVTVYDVQGRQLNTNHSTLNTKHYTLPAAGVYMVHIDGSTHRIVVK